VRPFGKYESVSEALQDFNATRDETLRFASEEGLHVLSRSATHLVLGPLYGVEAPLLIADHGRRHTALPLIGWRECYVRVCSSPIIAAD